MSEKGKPPGGNRAAGVHSDGTSRKVYLYYITSTLIFQYTPINQAESIRRCCSAGNHWLTEKYQPIAAIPRRAGNVVLSDKHNTIASALRRAKMREVN